MRMIKGVPKGYAALLGVSVVLAWTPLAIVAALLIIFALSRLLPWRFGFWTNIVASIILYAAFLACLAGAAWALGHIPLPAPAITTISVLLLGVIILLSNPQPLLPGKRELLVADDLIPLAVALVAMAFLLLPLLPKLSVSSIGPFMMYGGDNSAHLEMVQAITKNQGYAIGHHNRYNLGGILVAYPQGWHFATAYAQGLMDQLASVKNHPGLILGIFYGVSVLWWGMFVFLFARLSLMALAIKATLSQALLGKLLAATICLLGALSVFLSLFAYGFQTQISALVYLLLEVVCIAAAYTSKKPAERFIGLWIGLVILAGSGFSWLFLYPVSVTILAVAIIHSWIQLRKLPWQFIVGAIAAGVFVLYQPLVQVLVKVPTYQDGVTIINQRGNVALTSLAWVLMLSALAVAIAVVAWRQRLAKVLVGALLLSLAFSLILMWYQLGTIHELRYYYYKSTYTVLLLALIIIAAAVGWGVSRLMSQQPRQPRSQQLAMAGGVLAAFITISWSAVWLSATPELDGIVSKRLQGISSEQASTVINIVKSQPQDSWKILSIGSCNRGDDIRTTLLAGALSSFPPGVAAPSVVPLDNLDKDVLFAKISKYLRSSKDPLSIILLSNDQVIGRELMQSLDDSQKVKIQLVNLDPSPETETLAQCPERVHELPPNPTVSAVHP